VPTPTGSPPVLNENSAGDASKDGAQPFAATADDDTFGTALAAPGVEPITGPDSRADGDNYLGLEIALALVAGTAIVAAIVLSRRPSS